MAGVGGRAAAPQVCTQSAAALTEHSDQASKNPPAKPNFVLMRRAPKLYCAWENR